MNSLQHFDGPTFEADVLSSAEPVVVDFYADWCPPCRMMTPVVEQLAGEFAGKVKIGKLDVDYNQEIAIRYGVMGIPTLGRESRRLVCSARGSWSTAWSATPEEPVRLEPGSKKAQT